MRQHNKAWIGVDLDGTLAHYDKWQGGYIGDPIPEMVDRVKRWLADGRDVRIFTARADEPSNLPSIKFWCLEHLGAVLPGTNIKDKHMVELWDDRVVRVKKNSGEVDTTYEGIE